MSWPLSGMPDRCAPTTATFTSGSGGASGSASGAGSGRAGGALRQAGGVMEALAQLGQLQVAAAGPISVMPKGSPSSRRLAGTESAA